MGPSADATAGAAETPSARRIAITRAGGTDALRIEEMPSPPPGPGKVAIDVHAIGINLADVFCRLGLYRAAPAFPFSPGFEVAGVVSAVGGGVSGASSGDAGTGDVDARGGVASPLAVGDRVIAVTRFGGYATRLVTGAEWVRPLPEGWSFADGAAFPVAFLTAYHGLVTLAHLAPGETVVVQSAAGGVGTAACQLARAIGARVIGTVGSEGKRDVAREAGAEEVIVSRTYDVWDEVTRLTGGVDVVFDAVGGPGLRRAFEALKPGGRLMAYGFADMLPRGGRRNWLALAWRYLRTPRFNPFRMTESNRTVGGFNLVYLFGRPHLYANAMADLLARAGRGELRPVVGRTFPFDEVAAAHEFLQSRRSTGKVVLEV